MKDFFSGELTDVSVGSHHQPTGNKTSSTGIEPSTSPQRPLTHLSTIKALRVLASLSCTPVQLQFEIQPLLTYPHASMTGATSSAAISSAGQTHSSCLSIFHTLNQKRLLHWVMSLHWNVWWFNICLVTNTFEAKTSSIYNIFILCVCLCCC